MQYLHDSSFDKAEKELKEKGVSYSNAILDGTEYFYVLKENGSCGMELDLSRSCKICSDQYGKACEVDHMVYLSCLQLLLLVV